MGTSCVYQFGSYTCPKFARMTVSTNFLVTGFHIDTFRGEQIFLKCLQIFTSHSVRNLCWHVLHFTQLSATCVRKYIIFRNGLSCTKFPMTRAPIHKVFVTIYKLIRVLLYGSDSDNCHNVQNSVRKVSILTLVALYEIG